MNEKNKTKSPTLADVARVAGLSAMTVSRTLNNPSMVKSATLKKVQQAIECTGYIQNKMAGSLASNKSNLVAIVVPQINNGMFVETIEAISNTITKRGYHVLLSVAGFEQDNEADIVSNLLTRRPDGIVLTGVHHNNKLKKLLLNSQIPVVEIWDSTPTPIDMLVGLSHDAIGEEIGRLISKRKPKKVGLIWTKDERALKRKNGILKVLERESISYNSSYVPVPASLMSGREGLDKLLSQHQDIDTVACSTDTLAQGCITEARRRGLRVPEDLSVIGFGDLDIASSNIPSITTINIDRKGMGIKAATLLADRIENIEVTETVVDLEFSVIFRESFF
ncbi:LacI family DNA-binding transcriptional regulator [Vibrio mediterranei]|jgi:LacI family gluconate utilization system Gnt-I transcriptional repressor|uniref:LacI family DNA-binding transcriptional regulator n=1 Tax=Vibrio mediterranei TaxID=689 RepID=UPI001EFEE57E|nr:LacI family DNA-binding transcriptional regulator [Vibrio mediterranei]MCG9625209.1 LacI family DNA-binding transcriptional regulator [Vibrio mediterranei]